MQPPAILVADDEDVILTFVDMVLRRAGFRVLAAEDAATALRLTQQGAEPLALAVLDIIMPEMDGPALSRVLRKDYPDLRVLYMSGFNQEEVSRRCGGERSDFLRKPFTSEQLLNRVRRELERPVTIGV
jgi:two-component system cell cycle sensor histidine kinase/response regulator CckA